MKYQAILFDFDGTLANNLLYYVKAYDYALKKYNIHLSNKEIGSECFGKSEETITRNFNFPSAEEFRNYYFEGIRKHFTNVQLFEGAREVLEELDRNNIKLCLISFAFKWYIDMMLDQTNLRNYFPLIITFDDVKNAKPDPEGVLNASKKLHLPVENMLLVGDSSGDIRMGKAAGCDTALFLPKDNTLYYDFDSLRKLNPEYEFSNYEELSKIIV